MLKTQTAVAPKSPIGDRRIQLLLVDPLGVMAIFKEGLRVRQNYKIIKGVPEDAQLLGTSVDFNSGGLILALHSKEFRNIPENEKFPMIQVKIEVGE